MVGISLVPVYHEQTMTLPASLLIEGKVKNLILSVQFLNVILNFLSSLLANK